MLTGKYFFVELQVNEEEDQIKKEMILPYLNDDLWVTSELNDPPKMVYRSTKLQLLLVVLFYRGG